MVVSGVVDSVVVVSGVVDSVVVVSGVVDSVVAVDCDDSIGIISFVVVSPFLIIIYV